MIAIDQATYLIAFEWCVNLLPKQPPKDWEENALMQAKAYAKIIRRILEVFKNPSEGPAGN